MAKVQVQLAAAARKELFFALDSSSTTGAGKTGASGTMSAYYVRNETTPTATAIASPAFTEVSSGNMPGVYYLTVPLGAFAVGATTCVVMITGTGMAPVTMEYQLVAYNPDSATNLGLSALPTSTHSTAGGLITSGTGTAQLTTASGVVTVGTINANVITATSIATDAITAAKIADSAITIRLSTDATASEARLIAGTTASDVWNALVASYTTADTFGARLPRVTTGSASNQCELNASHHIAANVHQMQAGVVTAASIATGAIDADALATDAVTEIGTGVWTTDIASISTPGQAGLYVTNTNVDTSNTFSSVTTIEGTAYKESIADTILGRNVGGGSNAGRLVKEALYALRNKSEIVGALLSVYDASDNLSWTAVVASSSSADPVTGIDP